MGHLDINLVGLEALQGLGQGLHGRLDSLLDLLIGLGLLGLGLLFNLIEELLELLGYRLLDAMLTQSLLHLPRQLLELAALTWHTHLLASLLLAGRCHPGRTGALMHPSGYFFRHFLIKPFFYHLYTPLAAWVKNHC